MPINLPKIHFKPGAIDWELCRWLEKLQYEVNRLDNVRSSPGVHQLDSSQGMHFWAPPPSPESENLIWPVRFAPTTPVLTSWTTEGPKKTAPSNGEKSTDGDSWDFGDDIFLNFEGSPVDNGIWRVVAPGTVSTPAVVIRAPVQIKPGLQIQVNGGLNNCQMYKIQNQNTPTIGTDPQFYRAVANPRITVDAATIVPLNPAFTPTNDSSGLLLTGAGALPTVDGVTMEQYDTIHVAEETGENLQYNGPYIIMVTTPNYILRPYGPRTPYQEIIPLKGTTRAGRKSEAKSPGEYSSTQPSGYGWNPAPPLNKPVPGAQHGFFWPADMASSVVTNLAGLAMTLNNVTPSTVKPPMYDYSGNGMGSGSFNGTTSYGSLGSGSAILSGSNKCTLAVAFSVTALPTTAAVIYAENVPGGNIWSLAFNSTGLVGFFIYGYTEATSTQKLTIGRWYTAVCVQDPSVTDGRPAGMHLYVDGESWASTTNTSAYGGGAGVVNTVTVGRKIDSVNPGFDQYFFNGYISVLYPVSGSAWTPTQIKNWSLGAKAQSDTLTSSFKSKASGWSGNTAWSF